MTEKTGVCSRCGRTMGLRTNGVIASHLDARSTGLHFIYCMGSGEAPRKEDA